MTFPVSLLLLSLLAFGTTQAQTAAPAETAKAETAKKANLQTVHYDKAGDRLTLDVREIPLRGLLAQIGLRTGVEILMDPAIERRVSANFKAVPLTEGLQRISQGLSTVLIHDKPGGAKPGTPEVLVRMKVLPEGKHDSGQLQSLAAPVMEGVAHRYTAPLPSVAPGVTRLDHARARWEARMQELSPEQRAEVEKRVRQRLDEKAKQQAEREKNQADRAAKREERKSERLAREAALKQSNPALYEYRQQQQAQRRSGQSDLPSPDAEPAL